MTTAWVIAGASAKGAYQAGVLSTLPPPDFAVGTSVGALNAAGYSHAGPAGLLRLWRNIRSRGDIFANRLNPFGIWKESIWSSDPLRVLIDETVKGKPSFPWFATYVDLSSTSIVYGTTKEALLASASLPVVVPPVRGHLVDGGVMENAPLRFAIDKGADEIIVILGRNLYPKLDQNRPRPKNIIEVCWESMECMCAEVMRNDVIAANKKNLDPEKRMVSIRVIQPPADWSMGSLDFVPEKIDAAIRLGQRWDTHN